MNYKLSFTGNILKGEITLAGSKSVSNRVLIIQALCENDFKIDALANANDTALLSELLQSKEEILDAGPAGTTFRFMTAYLALFGGKRVLTGSERMKQRPIKVLVDALRSLGASISYLENEGYPPLQITSGSIVGNKKLSIPANTSSQYISALLLIAPSLPGGITLELTGKIVSRPYIEMTLGLMQYFGISHQWENNLIVIPEMPYEARPFVVEADWSAASYYYSLAAMSEQADIFLNGLFENSLQGDAALIEIFQHFGVKTSFTSKGIRLIKKDTPLPVDFHYDFILCPDLAQTLAVVCAGLGVKGYFSGLETLRIKETDRIQALENEISKGGCHITLFSSDSQTGKEVFEVSGKFETNKIPVFKTYEDHRMAMAFAPLALLMPVEIEEPRVVVKSYPDFWNDFQKLGLLIQQVEG
ncbi:MAG: 3-phosphoshikimate 1-carboxyvinyltransferase [Bacteroidetes bacterium]|nr:3-phosphoshikimate 1-carboxyvinyltransferase [Bacteroidota bacterium]